MYHGHFLGFTSQSLIIENVSLCKVVQLYLCVFEGKVSPALWVGSAVALL